MKKFILTSVLILSTVFFVFSQSEITNPETGSKFWGTSCGEEWSLPNGQTYKTCCYYILWMQVSCDIVAA